MGYTMSILCFLIVFIVWVKHTFFVEKFFKYISGCRQFLQCVFEGCQGDRLSKYLNSEILPRIWRMGKTWKKTWKKTNKRHHYTHKIREPVNALKFIEAFFVDEKNEGEAFRRRNLTFVRQKRTKNQKLSKKSHCSGCFSENTFRSDPQIFVLHLTCDAP